MTPDVSRPAGPFCSTAPLILASGSPRRQEFLKNLGLDFQVLPAVIDETPEPGENSVHFARRMALEKACQVAGIHPDSYIISADTVVTVRDRILGKPADGEEALAMLTALQDTTHTVITGLCLHHREKKITELQTCSTEVTFARFPETALRAYVATGEPLDKAGGYGIQGIGGFLVRHIRGSCSNVIGLPVSQLVTLLLHHQIVAPCPSREDSL
ncbi:Maf-like protein [Desulfolithobacter dissulfuricans]|uniref:dTTP/UTP pyrophosphatase n=1 Tax=Desulfolithobacter dissulfuricans TaxID=2795293 RepID=A0A915XKF5_9BACT|nr:nucleoside triphosphate pyrophosphatase [Desulfolithobacter dissulfuricans]BCO08201.1 Maf-like protein [Desulfolithobacter dissulfuricans]